MMKTKLSSIKYIGLGLLLAAGSTVLAATFVNQGGTGRSTFTASQLIYGNSTNPLSSVATSSITNGVGIGFTGTAGALVGGTPLTITNTGVTSVTAGTGISLSGSTGSVTISATGSGGGSGNVATSSQETSGRIPFWTSTAATPALLSGGSANFVWDNANSRLGIGTTTPFTLLGLSSAVPQIAIKDTTAGGNTYLIRNGALTTKDFDIFDIRAKTAPFYWQEGSGAAGTGSGMAIIGSTTNAIPGNNSRLFVFGGDNGANIDVMGDKSVSGGAGDTVSIEAEGSDYNSAAGGGVDSVSLRFYGPASSAAFKVLGYTAQRLGYLDFGQASTSIITTGINQIGAASDLIFGTGDIQRAVLAGTGNFGLGTTTPGSLLSVAGSSGGTIPLFSISSSTSAFATSTALLVDKNGSLSLLNGSTLTLAGITGTQCLHSIGGLVSGTGSDCGSSGAAFPFTPATNYGVNTSATTTALWGQAGIFASSSSAYPTLAVGQAGSGPAATFIGGNVGIGTTSPYGKLSLDAPATTAPYFVIGSSTSEVLKVTPSASPFLGVGTSSPMSTLSVVGNEAHYGAYTHFGLAAPLSQCNTALAASSCLELVGNDNTTGGVGVYEANINSGSSAFGGFVLTNNLTGTATTNYSGVFLNSSTYSDTTFGSLNAVPNLLQLGNSMGPVSIQSFAPTQAGSYINFFAGSTTPGVGPSTSGEVMRITSSGLGIGTTSPWAPLSVSTTTTGNASTTLFVVASSSNATLFNIIGNGWLGMNTTVQDAPITIDQNATALPVLGVFSGAGLHIGGKDGIANRLMLDAFGADNIINVRRADGTSASPITLAKDDRLLGFGAAGYNGTAYSVANMAQINFRAGEAWTTSAEGTYVNFVTTANGTLTATEKARFDPSGNLGIGTTTPTAIYVSVAASTTAGTIENGYQGLVSIIAGLENGVTKLFQEIDQWGHLITSGDTPTVSGGTSTVAGNDRNGTITVTGTLLTSVTLTFAHPYVTAPDCVISDSSTGITAGVSSITTTALTVAFSAGVNSGTVWYICQSHQ